MDLFLEMLGAFGKALRYSPAAAIGFALSTIVSFFYAVHYGQEYETSTKKQDARRLRILAAGIAAMFVCAVYLATGLPD